MPEMVSVEKEGDSYMKDVFGIEIRSKKENEISVWAVGTIEMNPFATGDLAKLQDQIFSVMVGTDGLVGAHPIFGEGTLFLFDTHPVFEKATFFFFDTEERANQAREAMKESGLPVGNRVAECFIPKADLNAYQEAMREQNEERRTV